MWDEAGDSDYKIDDVDNVKDENAYLCILDIDAQCEMRQVMLMIKQMMLTMCSENAYLCILDIDVQCESRKVMVMIKQMMLQYAVENAYLSILGMWDKAGDSDYKIDDVDNVKDEKAYLCILDIDVQCEMRQVMLMIKQMMFTICRWKYLPVRHWCPVGD